MNMDTKPQPKYKVRQAFRADANVNAEFERLIDEGGYNKSSVFRLLQQRWIDEQKAREEQ